MVRVPRMRGAMSRRIVRKDKASKMGSCGTFAVCLGRLIIIGLFMVAIVPRSGRMKTNSWKDAHRHPRAYHGVSSLKATACVQRLCVLSIMGHIGTFVSRKAMQVHFSPNQAAIACLFTIGNMKSSMGVWSMTLME